MTELTDNNDKDKNDKLVHYKKRYLKGNEARTSSEGKHSKMAVVHKHKSSEHKQTKHSDNKNTDRLKLPLKKTAVIKNRRKICRGQFRHEDLPLYKLGPSKSTGPPSPVNLDVEKQSNRTPGSEPRIQCRKKLTEEIIQKMNPTYVNKPPDMKYYDDNTQKITMSNEKIGRFRNMPILDLKGNTPEPKVKLKRLKLPGKVTKRVRFSDDKKDDYIVNERKLVRRNSTDTSKAARISILKRRHTILGSAPSPAESPDSEHSNQSRIAPNETDETHSNDQIPITNPIPPTTSTNNPEDEPPTLEISNEKPIGKTKSTIEQLQTLLLSCCKDSQNALDIASSDLFKNLIKKINSEHSASVAKAIIECLSKGKIQEIPQAILNTSAAQANVQIAQSATTVTNCLNPSFNAVQNPAQGNLFLISPFNPVSSTFQGSQVATISPIVAYPHIPIQENLPAEVPTTNKPPTKPRRGRPKKKPYVTGEKPNKAEINNNNEDKQNFSVNVRAFYTKPTTPQLPENSPSNSPFAQNIQPTFTFPVASPQPIQGPDVFRFNLSTYFPPSFQHHPPPYPVSTYGPQRFTCIETEIQLPRYTRPPFMPQNPSTVRPEQQRQAGYMVRDILDKRIKSNNSANKGCMLNSQNPKIADTSHIPPMGSQNFFPPMTNTPRHNIVTNRSANINMQSRVNQMQIADNDTRHKDCDCRTNGSNVLPHKDHMHVIENDRKQKGLKFRDPKRSINNKIKSCANLGSDLRQKKFTKLQGVPNEYLNENVSSHKIHMQAVEHDTIQKTWAKKRELDNGSVNTKGSRQTVHMQALEEGTIQKDWTNVREQSVTINVPPFANRVQFVRGEDTIQKDCTKLRRQSVNTNESPFVSRLPAAENDSPQKDWTKLREPSVNTSVPQFANRVQVVGKDTTQRDPTEVREQSVNTNVPPFSNRVQRVAGDAIQKDRTKLRQQFVNTNVPPFANRLQVVGKDTTQKNGTKLRGQSVNTNETPFAGRLQAVEEDSPQRNRNNVPEQSVNTNVPSFSSRVQFVGEDTIQKDCTEQRGQSVNTKKPPFVSRLQAAENDSPQKDWTKVREQSDNTKVPPFGKRIQVVGEDTIQKDFTEQEGQSVDTNEAPFVNRLQAAENDSPQKDWTRVREQSDNINVPPFGNRIQVVGEDTIQKDCTEQRGVSVNIKDPPFENRLQAAEDDSPQKNWTKVREQSVNTKMPPFANRVQLVAEHAIQKDRIKLREPSANTNVPPFANPVQVAGEDTIQKDCSKVRQQSVNTNVPPFANRVQLVVEDAIETDSTKLRGQFANTNVAPFANGSKVVGEDRIQKDCTEQRGQSVNSIKPPFVSRLEAAENDSPQKDWTKVREQHVNTNGPPFANRVQLVTEHAIQKHRIELEEQFANINVPPFANRSQVVGEDRIQKDCTEQRGQSVNNNEPPFSSRLQTAEDDSPQKDGTKVHEQSVNTNVPPFANRVQLVAEHAIQKDKIELREQFANTNVPPFANRVQLVAEDAIKEDSTKLREQSANTNVPPFSNRGQVVGEDTIQNDNTERGQSVNTNEPPFVNRLQAAEDDSSQKDCTKVREQSVNTNVPPFANRVQLFADDAIQKDRIKLGEQFANTNVPPFANPVQVVGKDTTQKNGTKLRGQSVNNNEAPFANRLQAVEEDSPQKDFTKSRGQSVNTNKPQFVNWLQATVDDSPQKDWTKVREQSVNTNVPPFTNRVQLVAEDAIQKDSTKLPEQFANTNVPPFTSLVPVVGEDTTQKNGTKLRELPNGTVYINQSSYENQMLTVKEPQQKEWVKLSEHTNSSIDNKFSSYETKMQVAKENTRRIHGDWQKLRESQKHRECVIQENTNVITQIKKVECCNPFETTKPPERTVSKEEVNENLPRNVKSSPELCDASESDQEAYTKSENADCPPGKIIGNSNHVTIGDDYVTYANKIRNSINLASTSIKNTEDRLTILPEILKETLKEDFDALVYTLAKQKEASDKVEKNCVQDTSTVNKTLCDVPGEDEQQQESVTELQTPSASNQINEEDTINQSDTKEKDVAEKQSEEIGGSVVKVLDEHKPNIGTVVHPPPSQPPSIDEGNTSVPDAPNTSVEDAPNSSIPEAPNAIVQDTPNTSVTATGDVITTSIVPDTSNDEERAVSPKKTFINGIVGRININKERRMIGSPDEYIPSKSKSTVGEIIPAHNSNNTKKNVHEDVPVDCMDLRVDRKRTYSTTETVEVPRKRPKQLDDCRKLPNNEKPVSITDSDGENIIEYIDITQDDVIAYTIPPMSAKKMRARMWRKTRQRQENNALRRSDCNGKNVRSEANGLGCNNTKPVRKLSGDVELESNVSESSTSSSTTTVTKTSLDSPHNDDKALIVKYELSDGRSDRENLQKEVDAKMPHGKMYYVRESNILVRYFDYAQMEMFLASLDGNCENVSHEELMRYIENENRNGENPERCNEIENLSIKSNEENRLADYNVRVNKKGKNEIIKLDKHVTFSMNESLSANEYVIEMKMVEESVPPDFRYYYQYVTRYQICNSHNPVSLQTFLMLHNTNRLRGLMKNYIVYLENKARDNAVQNKSS